VSEALPLEIDAAALADLRSRGVPHRVLDVREPWEFEICGIEGSVSIPMSMVPQRMSDIPAGEIVVVLCHHGRRSLRVAEWLRDQGFVQASSLSGGIDQWASRFDPEMPRY
jgi:rhodanese-related sulfurtransferase